MWGVIMSRDELARDLSVVSGSPINEPAIPAASPARFGRRRLWSRTVMVIALVILGLVAGSIGVVSAANDSLPGDRLYAVKTAVEDIRLALSTRQETEIKLNLRFAQQRVAEIEALIEEERPEFIQIAVGRYERHIKLATLALTQIPAQDRQRMADLADLVTNILSCECRSLVDLLPRVAAPYQSTIDSAVAVTRSNFEILTTVFVDGITPARLDSGPDPATVPAGSEQGLATPTALHQETATTTARPTSPPGGNAPTVPAARRTSTPTHSPSSSPTADRPLSPTPTDTRVAAATATPTSTDDPVATAAPAKETRTATMTSVVSPTQTPLPTASNTVVPTATNTPVPPATATDLPPGMTKTVEPPKLTKTPAPPGPTRTPKSR